MTTRSRIAAGLMLCMLICVCWGDSHDHGLVGAPRSGQWPRVRREHLVRQPDCQACGKTTGDLEVHHKTSFASPGGAALELDPANLITLCAQPCHLVHGHLMNYHRSNPTVEKDCRAYRSRLEAAKELQLSSATAP